jgi:hypothetical protein
MIVVFVGFSRIFLLGILMFKWLTARPLYKSFDVKGLTLSTTFIKINQLMMYKAKVAVCSEIRTKHSTQSEHHVELFNVKPGGT